MRRNWLSGRNTQGNILSDAIPISSVADSEGVNVAMPFLVSASNYEYYTFTYNVPSNTAAFTIYGSNVLADINSAPAYIMNVGY